MITLPQLRAFVAVAHHRHFTRAADSLLVAQPSVSYQVRELERELGVRLIEVVGRRVYLTDDGERLAERGTALLNELADIEREMREHGAGSVGRLRLGATRTIGGYALPTVLAGFHQSHPHVELNLTIANTRDVERMLLDRSLDIAVMEWKVTSPELTSCPLRRDALVLVAPPDHPLARAGQVQLEDLRGETFVMREQGSGTRALAEQALGQILAEVHIGLELDQPEAIVRAVEAGMGLTFISEVIVTRQLATGSLRALKVEGVDLWRDFSLAFLRTRPPSPSMRAFQAFIEQAWTVK